MPGADAIATHSEISFDRAGLDELIAALKGKGFRVLGPRIADDAVIYDELESAADLPSGWGDEQKGGHYRLKRRNDDQVFGYTLAPQGWKRALYPPTQKLFGATRTATGFTIDPPEPKAPPLALIGVRACEIAAMRIQGKVFGDKDFADPGYQERAGSAFIVAVECAQAGDTCFCASMGTGPAVGSGFDIKLVELVDKAHHSFMAIAGSKAGAALLKGLPGAPASEADRQAASGRIAKVAKSMSRKMNTAIADRLQDFPEHARWDEVAARCMTCGNCTMVCPTCFCTTVEDNTDLKGDHAERWRRWDSCFTIDFSYIHGGSVRTEARSRYRQWITHKLSTWHNQFQSSGCVGCGRCITWCPVGIDITEEVAAIAKSEGKQGRKSQ